MIEPAGLYRNKRVLVTGHTGFKGGWLSVWLNELGARVIGYSLEPPTRPSFFEAVDLKDRLVHIIGDVRDEARLLSVFREHRPEIVFHLAAQPLVRFSYREPRLTYETNVMGTVNVLEAVRKTEGIRACIIVTSDKCYENRETDYSYRETDPMGGYDPYSSSKGCAELVAAAYRRSLFEDSDGCSLSTARAGNVIGGGDWGADRLVPDCIKSFARGEKIALRNPGAVRPWQYILEPLSGYLRLGALMYERPGSYCGAWNFGPDDSAAITVRDLVELIIEYYGGGGFTVEGSTQPHEASFLKLDAGKARSLLGWRPVYDIAAAARRTVEWYRSFYAGTSKAALLELTVREILEYSDRV